MTSSKAGGLICEPLKGGIALIEHLELAEPAIFPLLLFNIFPDRIFIPSYRGYIVHSGPKMLTFVIPFLAHIDPGYMNGTLAFHITDDLRYGVFGRNRYEHMNVVLYQVTFKDFNFFSAG